jgi:hypothetical protein
MPIINKVIVLTLGPLCGEFDYFIIAADFFSTLISLNPGIEHRHLISLDVEFWIVFAVI